MTYLTKERLESALDDIIEYLKHPEKYTHKIERVVVLTQATEIRDSLINAKTAPTWQHIGTAPMDVLVDLLWEGKRFVDCNWDHICQEWRHMTHFNQLIFIKNPEYWMPTPPEKSE
ncbi:hypothetical protein L0663_05160 [Dyadobacter sp. CY107]|uniref:hypothetical protein n=1 Tax=Dyadobacter fanqingshengii TaxID=2906443 RepID=UPI001F2F6ED6|nr:hypothetical protein [Dyadobacter fanqingshengii]MCF2502756.1 hypothetical protein [Dyadobacter fanqingshengii]